MKTLTRLSLMLFVIGAAVEASAFNPQPDPPGFGIVGMTRGQTARLHVVLTEPEVGDRNRAPAFRHVLLQFVDGAGNVLTQSEARLQGGQAAHIDYRYQEPDGPDREVPRGITDRQHLRAIIRFVEDPNIKEAAPVLATLEVFDTATGETAFVLPGTAVCFGEVEGRPQR